MHASEPFHLCDIGTFSLVFKNQDLSRLDGTCLSLHYTPLPVGSHWRQGREVWVVSEASQ